MRSLKILGLLLVLAITVRPARAEVAPAAAIQGALDAQVAAWNRGDIDAFMSGYKDSPETTFIGKSVEHGYAMILNRYKTAYPSRDAMGKLDFSGIAVRQLGPTYAVVTGNFHLARSTAGGGDASGVFSLVWEKTPTGWKIILDHTS